MEGLALLGVVGRCLKGSTDTIANLIEVDCYDVADEPLSVCVIEDALGNITMLTTLLMLLMCSL